MVPPIKMLIISRKSRACVVKCIFAESLLVDFNARAFFLRNSSIENGITETA